MTAAAEGPAPEGPAPEGPTPEDLASEDPGREDPALEESSALVAHRFDRFPVLTDARLILRRVRPTDVPDVRDITMYDGVAATNDAEAAAILDRIEADGRRGESVHWGICLRPGHEVVGTCGFYRGFPGNVGEVGYVLRKRYRGRGIMTAALRRVVDFGFETMGLRGIVAYVDPENGASAAVLRRVGFEPAPWSGDELRFLLRRPSGG